MSGTPSRRLARNTALFPEEDTQITSSYRATYGGPAGLSASSWTSRSTTSPGSTPMSSRQHSLSQHNSFSASPGAGPGGDSVNMGDGVRSPISPGVSSSSIKLDMDRLDLQGSGSGEVIEAAAGVAGAGNKNSTNLDPLSRAEAALAAARQQLASSSGKVAPAPLPTTTTAAPLTGQEAGTNASNNKEPASDYTLANSEGISPSKIPFALQNSTEAPMTAAAMDAAHRVAGLVSILTTGRPNEQLKAANDLHELLKKHGEPVQRATHLAGGTHMLFTLLQAKQKTKQPDLQLACAAALSEVCKHPPAVEELVALQDGPSTIIAACLKGIAYGRDVYASLFITVVSAKDSNDAVKAACAVHKAVRVLVDILAGENPTSENNTNNTNLHAQKLALAALEALCIADPGPNLRKLAWGGGLASLVPLLKPPFDHSTTSAMNLLLLALDQDRRHAESLCSPALIEELSMLIADGDVDITLQIGATHVLGAVAALRSRKSDATQALNDCALPRACEILHQAEPLWTDGAPAAASLDSKNADLHAACAALIAHLSVGSPLCCHVVLFHAEALRTVVSVLSGRHEFGLVEVVLGTMANYAAAPTVVL